MNNMEQNVKREITANAAIAIQRIIVERQHELFIFLSELIEEVHELNPCSELLCQWRLRLLEGKTTGGSL